MSTTSEPTTKSLTMSNDEASALKTKMSFPTASPYRGGGAVVLVRFHCLLKLLSVGVPVLPTGGFSTGDIMVIDGADDVVVVVVVVVVVWEPPFCLAAAPNAPSLLLACPLAPESGSAK